MNLDLMQSLQEAEVLAGQIRTELRRMQDELPEMLGGALLQEYRRGTNEAAAAAERLHNQILALYAQAMTEL